MLLNSSNTFLSNPKTFHKYFAKPLKIQNGLNGVWNNYLLFNFINICSSANYFSTFVSIYFKPIYSFVSSKVRRLKEFSETYSLHQIMVLLTAVKYFHEKPSNLNLQY